MRIRAHRLGISAALVLFAAICWTLAAHLPEGLQTGLADLLPADAQMDGAWQQADRAQESVLNREIVALVGGADADKAFAHAEALANVWRASGLFTRVDSRHLPDLAALRREWQSLGIALLPRAVVRQLYDDPAAYFRARGADAFNPFAFALLPLDEDLPGFSRFLPAPPGRLQWQAARGMLSVEDARATWALLRAQLPEAHDARALLALIEHSAAAAQASGLTLLSSGGALFAAESRRQGERESTRMSITGIALTLALLLAVFRSARVLLLLVPLALGIAAGLAATLAVFGQVHMLTLVIGTSLIGVLIDFPLHWLTPARFTPGWQAAPAMQRLRPVFLVSLGITALGYALLWFTPLPVLRQSAVFSIAALAAAYAATALLLPPLFRHYQPRTMRLPRLLPTLPRLSHRWLIAAFALLALGNLRGNWQDDIRDWIHFSPARVADTQAIARLTGLATSGQYLLITGKTPDELLERSAAASDALQPLIAQGALDAGQSLSDWALPESTQHALQQQLAALAAQPDTLAASGLPVEALAQALRTHAARKPVSLETTLATTLSESWQALYLGAPEGEHLGILRLYGLRDSDALKNAIATLDGVRLMDKRAHLNTLFAQTRNQAAWLKLASWLGAWLLLAVLYGGKRGSAILALPLAAALATLGTFGWLGLPIGLFAMFGLLLAAAIGIDYAVYLQSADDSRDAKLASITLAAATTAISFALLAASQTPAVASFGFAVTAGVFCNWLLAAVFFAQFTDGRYQP
ncbi:MAG: hypothetical protein Q4D61_08215 [Cardiobacteriaceae bacterium]|nr:hypothetical protein [Cardiobacteriaceae bacterium]